MTYKIYTQLEQGKGPVTSVPVENLIQFGHPTSSGGGGSSNLTLEQARQNGNILEGDVEFYNGDVKLFQKYGDNYEKFIRFYDDVTFSMGLKYNDYQNDEMVQVNDSIIFHARNIEVRSTSVSFQGLTGSNEFNKQGDRKAFAQLGDVYDNMGGGGDLQSVTDLGNQTTNNILIGEETADRVEIYPHGYYSYYNDNRISLSDDAASFVSSINTTNLNSSGLNLGYSGKLVGGEESSIQINANGGGNLFVVFDDDYDLGKKSLNYVGAETLEKQSILTLYPGANFEMGTSDLDTSSNTHISTNIDASSSGYTNGLKISSTYNNLPTKGLFSDLYYGANYDDNTYIQKRYADELVSYSQEITVVGKWINGNQIFTQTLLTSEDPPTGMEIEFPRVVVGDYTIYKWTTDLSF